MNVFRRFTVDRAKVLEFYGDVLGLKPLPPIGMAGGNQMSRFQVGTSEIKLTGSTPGRQDKSGAVRDTTGLRVFTFFFPDEAALTSRFTAHGLPAPAFKAREGGTRGAMVLDPDSQWVELVVTPGAPPDTFSQLEVGLTVSDLAKSRAFYREFVGLDELKPIESAMLGVTKYPFRHGTMTVNVWSFGAGLPANTYTAGIQYVMSDVALVDARAKGAGRDNHDTSRQLRHGPADHLARRSGRHHQLLRAADAQHAGGSGASVVPGPWSLGLGPCSWSVLVVVRDVARARIPPDDVDQGPRTDPAPRTKDLLDVRVAEIRSAPGTWSSSSTGSRSSNSGCRQPENDRAGI